MGLAIPIETSARHIHLCREDFEILFGEGKELTFKSELSQPGQFACEERLEVRGPKGAIREGCSSWTFPWGDSGGNLYDRFQKTGNSRNDTSVRRHCRDTWMYTGGTVWKRGIRPRCDCGKTPYTHDTGTGISVKCKR